MSDVESYMVLVQTATNIGNNHNVELGNSPQFIAVILLPKLVILSTGKGLVSINMIKVLLVNKTFCWTTD